MESLSDHAFAGMVEVCNQVLRTAHHETTFSQEQWKTVDETVDKLKTGAPRSEVSGTLMRLFRYGEWQFAMQSAIKHKLPAHPNDFEPAVDVERTRNAVSEVKAWIASIAWRGSKCEVSPSEREDTDDDDDDQVYDPDDWDDDDDEVYDTDDEVDHTDDESVPCGECFLNQVNAMMDGFSNEPNSLERSMMGTDILDHIDHVNNKNSTKAVVDTVDWIRCEVRRERDGRTCICAFCQISQLDSAFHEMIDTPTWTTLERARGRICSLMNTCLKYGDGRRVTRALCSGRNLAKAVERMQADVWKREALKVARERQEAANARARHENQKVLRQNAINDASRRVAAAACAAVLGTIRAAEMERAQAAKNKLKQIRKLNADAAKRAVAARRARVEIPDQVTAHPDQATVKRFKAVEAVEADECDECVECVECEADESDVEAVECAKVEVAKVAKVAKVAEKSSGPSKSALKNKKTAERRKHKKDEQQKAIEKATAAAHQAEAKRLAEIEEAEFQRQLQEAIEASARDATNTTSQAAPPPPRNATNATNAKSPAAPPPPRPRPPVACNRGSTCRFFQMGTCRYFHSPPAQVPKLLKTTTKTIKPAGTGSGSECVVCMEEMLEINVLTACGHTLCSNCVLRIVGGGLCPTCRVPATASIRVWMP